MNDSNPYEPPHATSATSDQEPNQHTDAHPLVSIMAGILGAFFIAPALWVFIAMLTEQHTLAELSVVPAMIGGGIAVGWLSHSRHVLLRVLAWSAAGLGAGLVLEAILMGGLGVGTFITLSGLVLGVVGAVLGVRARPRMPNNRVGVAIADGAPHTTVQAAPERTGNVSLTSGCDCHPGNS